MKHLPLLIVLFILAQLCNAQTSQRIKVWCPSTACAAGVNSNSSQVGTGRRGTDLNLRNQEGQYVEVDTTTSSLLPPFLVSNTNDTGPGSFRNAIDSANLNFGLDTINFRIGSGSQTITPLSQLPPITSPVVINGTTQPGYIGSPIIELVGTHVGVGLDILAGNSTVRGLVVNRCNSTGIFINAIGGNVIENCFIGTNIAGTGPQVNLGNGVYILNSPGNRLGDTTSATRNIISGNKLPNVAIGGSLSVSNVVRGNYIGTDVTGLIDISPYDSCNGVVVRAPHNVIGGKQLGAGNVISGNNWPGIAFSDPLTSDNVVQGNYIGTDRYGYSALGNGKGIVITAGASNNTIGDTTTVGRNLISGNDSSGISIDGLATTNNVMWGNIIGTRANGEGFGIGNLAGILIFNSPNNIVGGTTPGADNYITANVEHGVVIKGSQATGNRIRGNYIGASASIFVEGMGNYGDGLFINNAPNNIIGGAEPLAGNYIGGNLSHGVEIVGVSATGNRVQGNHIGTDGILNRGNKGNGILLSASHDTIGGQELLLGNTIAYNKGIGVFDSMGTDNLIRYNSIYSNDSMGMDLAPRGITPNDSLDNDTGANNLQNFPILDSAIVSAGSIRIRGKLNSHPNTVYTIDFYKNDTRDPSHFGEGQTFIGTMPCICDASGKFDLTVTFPVTIRTDQFITATAIDPQGNTSEFSRALCLLDSDGDGILDCWESEGDGMDVNADGILDLDLWHKGARPDHKDVFVEIDYMDTYRPDEIVLNSVRAAFHSVPNTLVHNPDGMNGINLWTEMDLTEAPVYNRAWADDPWPQFTIEKAAHFGTVAESTSTNRRNILEAKKLVYRYCIFANAFANATSNLARTGGATRMIPGNDFFVSLGRWRVPGGTHEEQEGTFMHELGHSLGLHHGGNDEHNNKPNYYSVMNYVFQVIADPLRPESWKLNYSPAALGTLLESHLPEFQGLSDLNSGYFPIVSIPYRRRNGSIAQAWLKPNTAVDWDGNGDSSGFALDTVDVNHIDLNDDPSPGDTLYGYADWPNLKYDFRHSPGFSFDSSSGFGSPIDEMTEERYMHLQSLPPYGIVTPTVLWSIDPAANTPVSSQPSGLRYGESIVGDGAGGAIIAWGSSVGLVVYAQRIDTLGGVQWQNNGVRISSSLHSPYNYCLTSDLAGGAVIMWEDMVDPNHTGTGPHNLHAQRVNRFGQALWATDGVPVTALANEQASMWPFITSDSHGGAIIVWRDRHSGTNSIYAQRINASGTLQWTADGVVIATSPAPTTGDSYKITSDNAGGIIIVWEDGRNGSNKDIFAQRVDSSGNVQWTPDGVPICTATGVQVLPVIVGDGDGGAVVGWQDHRDGTADIYAQRISSAGGVQWASNGVPISTGAGQQYYPIIASDGSRGAIIVFADTRHSLVDLFAQRINAAGSTQWTTNGIAITDSSRSYISDYYKTIVPDDAGGAIITFQSSSNTFPNIWAQRVDSSGSIEWRTDGVSISIAAFAQGIAVTSNHAGGAIFTWEDKRGDPVHNIYHIYAQNVTKGGGLGSGAFTGVGENGHGGLPAAITLSQNYPNPFNPSTTIRYALPERSLVTLKIYNILGQEVATLIDGMEEPGAKQMHFNGNHLASGVYFYRLMTTVVATHVTSMSVKKMMLIK